MACRHCERENICGYRRSKNFFIAEAKICLQNLHRQICYCHSNGPARILRVVALAATT